MSLELYDVQLLACKFAKKYGIHKKKDTTEDAGTKKCSENFFIFEIDDIRTIVSQVEEIKIIIPKIIVEE